MDDISLFPLTTKISPSGQLTIADQSLEELAKTYGTPFYIYDGATIANQVNSLRSLLATHYRGKATVGLCSEGLFFTRHRQQNWLLWALAAIVVSVGEMKVAQRAGFAMEGLHLHGNNKSADELNLALDWGIQANRGRQPG